MSAAPVERAAFSGRPETVLGQVLAAHGNACACSGQCGAKHKDGGGICRQLTRPDRPLVAAPKWVGLSDHEAARLPVDRLMPWCPGCLTKARSAARREREQRNAEALAAAQLGLFDL